MQVSEGLYNFKAKNNSYFSCRPKFRGEVEMPVLLGSDDPAHNVTILDQAGKAIEWNGKVGYVRFIGWVYVGRL